MIEKIRTEEQQVRDTEARYRDSIQALRPKLPRWDMDTRTFRRPEFAVLGEIDNVPVIEVAIKVGGKSEHDSVAKRAIFEGHDYVLATSVLPWHTYSTMGRTIRLVAEGVPQVFGIVEEGRYNPSEIGIYVPKETLSTARKRHVEEVLRDYPAVDVSIEEMSQLNLSSDFIFRIEAQADLAQFYSRSIVKNIALKPVTNGLGFEGAKLGFPREVTEVYVDNILGPEIWLKDFFDGKRHPRLERIREAIGARAYQRTSGYKGISPSNYLFRFDRVLSTSEIAGVLERLGKPEEGRYSLTFHRLSDELRELVNLPLEKAKSASFVQADVDEDFKPGERPKNWDYLSISMY